MASQPVILVLGAGKRIGTQTAQRFAEGGYKVALVSRQQDGDAGYTNIQADLTDVKAVETVFEQVRKELGEPSVVVYNGTYVDMPGSGLASVSSPRRLLPHGPAYILYSSGLPPSIPHSLTIVQTSLWPHSRIPGGPLFSVPDHIRPRPDRQHEQRLRGDPRSPEILPEDGPRLRHVHLHGQLPEHARHRASIHRSRGRENRLGEIDPDGRAGLWAQGI